jgi:hypothetical protein
VPAARAVARRRRAAGVDTLHAPTVFLAIALVMLTACAQAVPADKAVYVGTWSGPGFSLLITQDGTVRYRRLRDGASTTVSGPLQSFEGSDFRVGVGPFATTFVVSEPPRRVDGQWRMTVDGVELRRSE